MYRVYLIRKNKVLTFISKYSPKLGEFESGSNP